MNELEIALEKARKEYDKSITNSIIEKLEKNDIKYENDDEMVYINFGKGNIRKFYKFNYYESYIEKVFNDINENII